MGLAERRSLRIVTLCLLYVAQGIPWGFTATTLPAFLVKRGLDFGVVTATLSFTTLPYSFKWIWGLVIDRFQIPRLGRRRPWIVFAQLMMAVTIGAMLALDVTTEVKMLAWMVCIHTVFNALQDVAVDALAVEMLGDDERGSVNGLMYGSKYFGGVIGGAGMASMIAAYGLPSALTFQVAVLLAIMLVPLFVRERAQPAADEKRPTLADIVRGMEQVFSLRSPLVGALLMLTMLFASGIVVATAYNLFLGELHWSLTRYSKISGLWGLLVGGGVAMGTGFLVAKFGRRRIAALASLGLAATWAVFALSRAQWSDTTFIYVTALVAEAFLSAMAVALISLCMDMSWPAIAASQFTLYMALMNFSATLGFLFAAYANKWWSFSKIYLVAAGIQAVSTLLLLPIDPGEARAKLPLPRASRSGLVALGLLLVFLIVMTAKATLEKLG